MWLEGQVVGEELKDKLKTRYTGIKTPNCRIQIEGISMGNRMGKCESRLKTEIYLAFKTFDN